MNPRSLRHRLEKAAKLLVIIQNYFPDVNCHVDEDKGEHGYTIADFSSMSASQDKIEKLGKDLEGKGYQFTRKRSPWLGQITYTGRADGKGTIVLMLPITKDRMNINQDEPETAYSFKSA